MNHAYGYHYNIIASPDETKTLATIDVEQWGYVLSVVQDRLRWLYTQKGVAYVAIYADSGKDSGTKLNPSPFAHDVFFNYSAKN